jgi:ferritin
MSICKVRWTLINFEKLVHQIISHALPILADQLTDFLAKRNVESVYPDTIGGYIDFSSPVEAFNFMLEEFCKFEDEISDVIDFVIATDKDYVVKQFLQSFLDNWTNYVETMTNICNLVVEFAPNNETLGMQLFDDNFEKAFTVSDITPLRIVLAGG